MKRDHAGLYITMMKANCKIPLLGYRDSYPILHYDCPRLSLIDDHISLNSLASYLLYGNCLFR